MKKTRILQVGFLLCSIVILLTSCKVNWFDKQYDVPWWTVALPVVAIFLITWVVAGRHIASKTYVCPQCNHTFSPKWWKAAFTVHVNSDRVFKCPHCGKRSFCRLSRDRED